MERINIALLIAVVARGAVTGFGVGEAIAILSLSALNGLTIYLNSQKQEPLSDKVEKELVELRSAIAATRVFSGTKIGR
jgi:hypothetical protein